MENTEQTVKKSTPKKILIIFLNVLFYSFIIFLLVFAISNIASKDKQNIPNIFGLGYMNVISDSMEGDKDDSIFVNDLIFIKMANEKLIENLEPNKSIITYYDVKEEKVITHRLVDIYLDGDTKIYVTQGDKVIIDYPYDEYPAECTVEKRNDLLLNKRIEIFTADKILAVYTGTKWDGFGKVLTFLQSKLGFGLCIVLPTALLLFYEGFVLVKSLMELNSQKLAKQLADSSASKEIDLEEERRKIREQLLAEMNQNKEENNDQNKDLNIEQKEETDKKDSE